MATVTISNLTETTAPATNDQFVVWSASTAGTRRLKAENLDKLVFRTRPADTDPTGKTFPVLTYSSGVPTVEALTFENLVLGIDINTANLADGSVTQEKIAASIRENAWVEKTTSYTAVAKDRIFADTTGGGFTITLPASPAVFDWIIVSDITRTWPTNQLTLARGSTSHRINGLAESLVCDVSAEIILRYEGSTQGWRVFAYGN
jgi:hypothetical protein